MARVIVNGPLCGKQRMLESAVSDSKTRVWWAGVANSVRIYVKSELGADGKRRSFWRVGGISTFTDWKLAKDGPQSAANAARKAVLKLSEVLQKGCAA